MTTPDSLCHTAEHALPWYAVHVRSNFERLVQRTLEEKGHEVFLPAYKVERRWSDRIKQMEKPLFPGYVFCRMYPDNRLPVLSVSGVVQIVGHGRIPAPVSNEEIAAVKTILKSNLSYGPWPTLAPGLQIMVDRGPLMGVQGVLLEVRGKQRLIVSIMMLQRSVAVELDAAWVRPSRPVAGSFAACQALT